MSRRVGSALSRSATTLCRLSRFSGSRVVLRTHHGARGVLGSRPGLEEQSCFPKRLERGWRSPWAQRSVSGSSSHNHSVQAVRSVHSNHAHVTAPAKNAHTQATDTIYQVASGRDLAGVSIVRVSGPQALTAFHALTRRKQPPPVRYAVRCNLYAPGGVDAPAEALDLGILALYFQAPHSFTGEDVVEFHVHGSKTVVSSVLSALGALSVPLPGLRSAEAGEFTRRSFQNGKCDLTQVEALADLLTSQTEEQRKQAVKQLSGSLGVLYNEWRESLVTALAHVEAVIDFAEDEEDVGEAEVLAHVSPRVDALRTALNTHLSDSNRGELIREGISVAIVGAPNVGKSSLLNHLAQRAVAIVSDEAGTTRDVLQVALDVGGYCVTLADTAGMRPWQQDESEASRESQSQAGLGPVVGAVEREGIRRADSAMHDAHVRLAVLDGARVSHLVTEQRDTPLQHRAWLAQALPSAVVQLMQEQPDSFVLVLNKSDLVAPPHLLPVQTQREAHSSAEPVSCWISCEDGDGLDVLLGHVMEKVQQRLESTSTSAPLITRERHRMLLTQCLGHLELFAHWHSSGDVVLAAEELRLSTRALGALVGRVDVEDLLDVIFRDFCIGK